MSVFGIFRNAIVLGWVVVGLLSIGMALGLWAFQLKSTVATMAANAAATAIAHRKEMARAVAKVKAKARLRRAVVAVPALGVAAVVIFESQDYQEWKKDNPDKTANDYACEVGELTAEVMDEVLQELPMWVRPSPDTVMEQIPKCLDDDLTLI